MTDKAQSHIWGKESTRFRSELDKILRSQADVELSDWLAPLEASLYLEREGLFFLAIPKGALPKKFQFEGDYLIIGAPFSNVHFLRYSTGQCYLDIYGR